MFGFSPTCVDAFGEYPQAYGLGDYPTTGEIAAAVLAAMQTSPPPSDVRLVNGIAITGAGIPPTVVDGVITDPGDPWGPAP